MNPIGSTASSKHDPGGLRPVFLALIPALAALLALGCTSAVKTPAAGRSSADGAAAAATSSRAQGDAAAVASSLPLTAALPIDPAVRTGRLDNGLSFYVRRNARPEKRAEVWLAVNAGSTLEDDDQLGLAHFVEHMAFNGTRRFKKMEIINFLERTGMRFGPDVNAYTNFDETVYTLRIPTDDPATIETAFQILEDWSSAVTFEDVEIDKERGVVVEEWRSGRGAEARMRDKQFPTLFKDSRYAERLTIGKKEVLETAPHDVLRRFYRDWYRPDLMAVIAVGDFDPAQIETKIREHFRSLQGPKKPRPRAVFPVPPHDATLVSVATDPEATTTRVSVYYKLSRRGRGTVGDYRRILVESLYHSMINARLDELRQRPNPPFLSAFSSSGGFVRSEDLAFQTAIVEEKGLDRGLEALLTELSRVRAHGFQSTELDRAKNQMLRYYESAYSERNKEESDRFANEILNAFLEGEAMPGIAFELDLAKRFLTGIGLEEVNLLAREWSGEANRVILVNAPAKPGVEAPAEARIREVFRAAQAAKVEPWVDRVRQEPLVSTPPAAGRVVEESSIDDLGVTRWKLANGVTVILKPTDFKDDEVALSGFSPGSSLVPDTQYVSANQAGQVLSEGGLGTFDQIELQKALMGKIANAWGFIGELEEGVRGSASPRDFTTMLQLVYMTITSPRSDEAAVDAWKTRSKGSLQNRLARPEAVFGDRMTVTMAQGHFRRRPPSVAQIDEVDLKTAASVWTDRFADVGDSVFVIVGSFKPGEIRSDVETYLGGLPSKGRREQWKDVGVRPPEGSQTVEVRKGIEPKSQVRIVFTTDAKWTREESHLVSSLGQALRIRLREVLREDLGGVYGVGAGGGISRRPTQQSSFSISFGCSPDRVDELKKAVLEVLDAAKKDGFSPEIVEKVREQQIRAHETDLRENGYWQGVLENAERFGDDPHEVLDQGRLTKLVTSDALREAARRYLDPKRCITGLLYPEAR